MDKLMKASSSAKAWINGLVKGDALAAVHWTGIRTDNAGAQTLITPRL